MTTVSLLPNNTLTVSNITVVKRGPLTAMETTVLTGTMHDILTDVVATVLIHILHTFLAYISIDTMSPTPNIAPTTTTHTKLSTPLLTTLNSTPINVKEFTNSCI